MGNTVGLREPKESRRILSSHIPAEIHLITRPLGFQGGEIQNGWEML
jgi:hypothetical protein